MLTLTSPVETWAHHMPAAVKLAALCGATVGLFALRTPLPLSGAAVAGLALILSGGGVFARSAWQHLRPLWPFVVIVAVWHLWSQDLSGGAVVILRMLTAVALANFVTMTTRLTDMIAVLERLASPLRLLGLSPRTLALAVALVIRFIPVMQEKFEQIHQSWRARSARRAGWRVLMPATLAALDDAEHVAEALRARGGAV